MIETDRKGVFADCALADNFKVAHFISLWGTHTEITALMADITADKCKTLEIAGKNFAVDKYLHKEISRISDSADNPYKDLVNIWLYKRELINGNDRRMVLKAGGEVTDDEVWSVIKEISIIPLLDIWHEPIIELFAAKECIKPLTGYSNGVFGKLIVLDNEFENHYQKLLTTGQLATAEVGV